MMMPFNSSDIRLGRRLEEAEAENGFALARAAASGSIVAEPIAGGCALFAGVGSPITHALGIGMNGPVAAEELDRLEEFFRSRSTPCVIDLCSMADPGLIEQIIARKYRVVEFNNVMLRRIENGDAHTAAGGPCSVRRARESELPRWFRVMMEGFTGTPEIPPEMQAVLDSLPALGDPFFAEMDGAPCGAGALSIQKDVALLYGDSTLIAARGKGIQQALIRHRLNLAVENGCEWAMACVLPGSVSHRNYERCGFRLFYMRVNVARDWD